jgi:hypothetical protein
MATPPQPKVKPASYTGLDSDNQFNTDNRVRMEPVAAKSSSTTTVLVVVALAVIAGLA